MESEGTPGRRTLDSPTEERTEVNDAGVVQLVERNLAKVEVVGSKPIARSKSDDGAVPK